MRPTHKLAIPPPSSVEKYPGGVGAGPHFDTHRGTQNMITDLNLEDPSWTPLALAKRADIAFRTTLSHLNIDAEPCEISLLACDDARISALNADFRDRNGATNVLSWPENDLAAETAGTMPTPPKLDFAGDMALGDIAISYERALAQAETAGHDVAHELSVLTAHGVLHLLGYDHAESEEHRVMFGKTDDILAAVPANSGGRSND